MDQGANAIAIGAGAGYAIGDVLPKPHPDTGPATQREVDDVYSTYGSDVVTGGYDPKGGAKHQAMKDVRESRVQYLAMLARARRQTRAGKEDLAQQSRDTAETIRDKKLRGGLDGFLRSMFQSGAAGVKSAVKGVGDATGAVLRS